MGGATTTQVCDGWRNHYKRRRQQGAGGGPGTRTRGSGFLEQAAVGALREPRGRWDTGGGA